MALRRTLAVLTGGAAALVPAVGVEAQINTIPSLTASVGGAYSTNPFLTAEGQDSASVQVDVRPSLQLIDGTNQAVIFGNYNRADYLTRYGTNSGYGVGVNGSTRPNPRTTLGFTASFDSQILGTQNGFQTPGNPIFGVPGTGVGVGTDTGSGAGTTTPIATTPVVPTPVVTLPGVIVGDVGLVGLRQRRNALSAGVNGSYAVSARSTWNAGLNFSRSTFPGGSRASELGIVASDFSNYTANFGYNRSLTELSSVGFQISATRARFDRGLNSDVYNPRITYNRTLSERWTMSAAVGAGITDDDAGTRVTVTVDGSLCRNGERISGCVIAARTPSPTGFGGVRNTTTVGANFTYRLGEFTTAALSGNYTRIGKVQSGLDPALVLDGQELFQVDASLQRALGRRLSAVASVGYRDASGIGANIPGDITGRLGLSVYLGRR